MNGAEFDPNEGNIELTEDEDTRVASLLESKVAFDALQAVRDLLLAGVQLKTGMHQAVLAALKKAGMSDENAPQLEAGLIEVIRKQMLRSVVLKLISSEEMTVTELRGEIKSFGYDQENADRIAAVLFQKREGLRRAAAAKIKGKVLGRLEARQSPSQREMMGKMLDKMFEVGVNPIKEEDVVEAWKRVKANDKP